VKGKEGQVILGNPAPSAGVFLISLSSLEITLSLDSKGGNPTPTYSACVHVYVVYVVQS